MNIEIMKKTLDKSANEFAKSEGKVDYLERKVEKYDNDIISAVEGDYKNYLENLSIRADNDLTDARIEAKEKEKKMCNDSKILKNAYALIAQDRAKYDAN